MGTISESVKTFTAGLVAIGLVTAVGLHAAGLAQVGGAAGTATNNVLGTAEKG